MKKKEINQIAKQKKTKEDKARKETLKELELYTNYNSFLEGEEGETEELKTKRQERLEVLKPLFDDLKFTDCDIKDKSKEIIQAMNMWGFDHISFVGFKRFMGWKLKEEEKRDSEKRTDLVNSFLKEKRPNFQSLGCGFHNGDYYFGTKLYREGKGYTSIVTSKKEVFINKAIKAGGQSVGENEIKARFGLNYKDDFFDEGLNNIFTNEAINKFLNEDTSQITIEKTFNKIVKLLKEYIYLETESKYKMVACYRIASFFMPIWDVRARLFLHAEFGSAKSRLTNILSNTGFNSVAVGDWTLPFLQRLIESTRGETHIDDFESLGEEKQNDAKRLIKTGYMKGFKAGKTGDKNRHPEVYDLFNTTTINNTEGLDFITNDRVINIRIPKIASKKYDKEPNFKEPIWNEIREELYILGLKEADKVEKIYPTIKSDKINGRLLSIVKPELTIAKLISDKLFDEIEEWWKEEIGQRDNREVLNDWEFKALEKLHEIVVIDGKEDYFFLLNGVVLPLIDEMYSDEFDRIKRYKYKMTTVIGNILSRNPRFKSRRINGKVQYKISKLDLIQLLKTKRVFEHLVECTSTTPTTTTTTTTTTTPTELVEDVADVGVVAPDKGLPKPLQSLILLIKEQDKKNKGKGTPTEELVVVAQENIETKGETPSILALLEHLKEKGIIFNPKPDVWKVL